MNELFDLLDLCSTKTGSEDLRHVSASTFESRTRGPELPDLSFSDAHLPALICTSSYSITASLKEGQGKGL